MIDNNEITHLHVHTGYSLLDGAASPEAMVHRAKELGMKAIAITDHNHVAGVYDFQHACEEEGIKSILGCCLPNQIIYTLDGPKEIKDIKIGDYVLTHTGTYQKVLRHWSREYNGTLYGIESWNTNTVWLTNEHPIYTKHITKQNNCFNEKLEFIRADEINITHKGKWRKGKKQQKLWEYYSIFPKTKEIYCNTINIIDYLDNTQYKINNDGFIERIKTNKYQSTFTGIKNILPITNSFMKLIGYFLAEGSYLKNKKGEKTAFNFTFNYYEDEYVNDVVNLVKEVFNLKAHIYKRIEKTASDISVCNKVLATFLSNFIGDYCYNKYIPTILLQQTNDKQFDLLQGLINGDGKITEKEVYIKLSNKKLIYTIKQLLCNLGYNSKITEIKNKNRNAYNVRYTINKKTRYYHEDENYIYTPIKRVKYKYYNGLVYNFEVENDNSYVSDITLHNCEMYFTPSTDILSSSPEERYQYAINKALLAGVEIPEKINNKKVTKKQIKEILEPYEYNTKSFHILFLAMNQKGWNNLVKLQSEASEKCTYKSRFHCDLEMIEKYNKGLIMTTACIGSYPAYLINHNKEKEAEEWIDKCHKIFGDRLYLEIQPLNNEEQIKVNLQYIKWSKEKNIPLVATNDVHYLTQEDHDDHDTLLCIGTGKFKDDTDRMRYTNDFWLRTREEMEYYFSVQLNNILSIEDDFISIPEEQEHYMKYINTAINNTNLIADRIDENIKLGSDVDLFPKVQIPSYLTEKEYLTLLAFEGLYKYLKKHPDKQAIRKQYEKRLNFELNVINKKGFAPYMLTVYEYVNWCRENDIPVGPGRGSAAGSLCLFCIGVTKRIDPLEYKLLFSRFLTEDRTSPPDIDLDFPYFSRDKVVEHLENYYGKEKVCHIGTYIELGVKSGLKDVGRVLRYDFSTMNAITKEIDDITDCTPSIKFKDIDKYEEGTELEKQKYKQFKSLENKYPELFRLARKFEGNKKSVGIHASGVLVMPFAVNELFPTRVDKDTGVKVTLYTGSQLEKLKAIKLDLLGLKNLDIIDMTLKKVMPGVSVDEFYETVNINDEKVYEYLTSAETDGVFQLESNLFKNTIKNLKPTNLYDIIAMNSFLRPGPLNVGMDKKYINRKHGEEKIIEPLPNTMDIVENSYGTIIYQETCMMIAQRVAGFNDNQADSFLRKGISKKKKELVELCNQWFIYGKINEEPPENYDPENHNQVMYDPTAKYGEPIKGGISNGYNKEQLIAYCKDLEGYSSYLFNLSHAATYSLISYMTAYLKYYYPKEYLAALLSLQETKEKIDSYIKVARKMNVKVFKPDINISGKFFESTDKGIYFGLRSIAGVGEAVIPTIIENRPYSGLNDALEKIPKKAFSKRIAINLIKSGCFDFENNNRNVLINNFLTARKEKEGFVNTDEYKESTCTAYEKEVLGTSISYLPYWERIKTNTSIELTFNLISVREIKDKKGGLMAFVKAEIENCEVDCIVFSKVYCKNIDLFDLNYHQTVTMKGKKDDKGAFIVDSVKR